jgi:hypothetical protein
MRTVLPVVLLLFAFGVSVAQNGYPKYYEMVALDAKADSLYKAKDYKNAAKYYTATANIVVEKAITMYYADIWYDAACSWALANVADSAFAELNMIATRMNYSNYQHLIADRDFASLHSDSRWAPLCQIVKANDEAKKAADKNYSDRTTYTAKPGEVVFYPHTEQMRRFIDNDSLPFLSIDYRWVRIYFRGNSPISQHLDQIRQSVDSAYHRIFSVLNIPEFHRGINLIFVDSAGELKELTGMYVHGGFSSQGNDEVFFVWSGEGKPGLKHEIFHFISNDIWGPNPKSRLLNEGGAVYTEYGCAGEQSLYAISAHLLKEKKLFSFDSLITDFHAMEMQSEEIAYFESAAIFKCLYERYGIDKMKQLWVKGFDSFELIYGISLKQFEQQWIEFISTVKPPARFDWDVITGSNCD